MGFEELDCLIGRPTGLVEPLLKGMMDTATLVVPASVILIRVPARGLLSEPFPIVGMIVEGKDVASGPVIWRFGPHRFNLFFDLVLLEMSSP